MNPKILGIVFIVVGLISLGLVLMDIFGWTGYIPTAVGLIMGPVLLGVGIKQGY